MVDGEAVAVDCSIIAEVLVAMSGISAQAPLRPRQPFYFDP